MEDFKTKNGFKPEIMKNIFNLTEPPYHLGDNNQLERNSVNAVRYRLKQFLI